MNKIVFVCTGNTCRSPMAKIIAENLIGSITFDSAGIFAVEGDRIAANAQQVLEEDDYTVGSFRSKRVQEDLIIQADLILTMTKEQKEIIKTFFTGYSQKVYTLKEYTGCDEGTLDIHDPFGKSMDAYRETASEIKEEIKRLRRKLVKKYRIE